MTAAVEPDWLHEDRVWRLEQLAADHDTVEPPPTASTAPEIGTLGAVPPSPTPSAATAERARGASWQDVDLLAALAGEGPPPPAVGHVDGSEPLLYASKVHWLFGEPGVGKGWIALAIVAQQLAQNRHVLYLDFEDSAAGIVGRLRDLLVPADVIVEYLHYKNPVDPSAAGIEHVIEQATRLDVPLVVVDGITEAMTAFGLDPEKSSRDTATFMATLLRPIAAAGPAVVGIDHVTKSRETRGRYAFGSQHKLAGVDGVSYSVDQIVPFARGKSGKVKLVVGKDRSGYHPQGKAVEAHVEAHPDGGLTVTFTATRTVDDDGTTIPWALMTKAIAYLQEHPGASKTDLRKLGKAEWVDKGIARLIQHGHLRVEQDGQTRRHYRTDKPIDFTPDGPKPDTNPT